jgi:uncharacterized protein (TIGR02284 family)
MNDKEIANTLHSLVQLDIDAVHAYKEAIEKIDDVTIREQLTTYQQDHERHISDLSAEIRALGETPPEFSLDFKGYFIQGFTSLRSVTGTDGALKAMQTNEKMTNKEYREASTKVFPVRIQDIISKAYEDEKRHLDFIDMKIQRLS